MNHHSQMAAEWKELTDKFLSLTTDVTGDEQAHALVEQVPTLDKAVSLAPLLELVRTIPHINP
ncbi:hypothetical protein [Arthrobacter sp. W4I7]|uniref:hypothetical protein n=1 Tax=Arthrobacter sp. W4I7 TaxID=3042296 RepID=UPI00278A0C54|nr:hypothetical protein [Arthrobacter sp. W4I7]MDQ0691393.1 hypothetical protein [Arthrobacter sp. W4I7]